MLAASPQAATTAQEMYLAAMAREQAVRAATRRRRMCPTSVSATSARSSTDYQEIVAAIPDQRIQRQRPVAGRRLSIDAFRVFGQERDRTTGVRLLRSAGVGVSGQQSGEGGSGAACARRRTTGGRA